MNIKQAKQQIRNTLRAYLERDELGRYRIPPLRQRPVLLMGPPGIGKTQIMEQIAAEENVGLVAYTITHHTRQSAMGLPFIEKRVYGGEEFSVTAYTMSEIIGAVYELTERTGITEGILFLDEINCVSETLAPMMLQFLQCKTFGNQRLPEGWLIVAAGNPPEYNRSVRDFDVVTLDRVKRIEVREDFAVWKEYALNRDYSSLIRGLCPALTLGSLRAQTLEMDGANLSGNEIFEYNGNVYYARYETLDRSRSSEVNLVVILQDITERQKLESMQKDFVANVSHELNTPLTTIKSYTETMLDSEGVLQQEDLVRQFLTVIDSEADRMSRLVKDLLQLSRLESQRETWHKSVQNITAIVESVIQKNMINANNKNQQLNALFDPAGDLPAYVDPDKIEQVLLNILSNAIKYTESGGRIDVDALRRGDYIYITVRDNGIGIAEKEMSRLFERFYRVDKARSRSMGSGTGLGLSIAKQIVEEHEGTISIESKEGKGTAVTIRLPLYRP